MTQQVERRTVESEVDHGEAVSVVVDGSQHDLDPATSAVWRAAASAPTLQELLARVDLPERDVWAALDRLGDLGLLETRPTPPGADDVVVPIAGTTRRRLLQLGVGAAATGAAIVATSRLAAAADAETRSKEKEARDKAREVKRK